LAKIAENSDHNIGPRKNFRFHPDIAATAEQTLRDVADVMKKSSRQDDVTFVGIHNRRTDHLEFVKRLAKAKPIGKKYFMEAMDYFRYDFSTG
jgi:O-glycosyl hydrolase